MIVRVSSDHFAKSINRGAFVIEAQCVLSKVRTELLNIACINLNKGLLHNLIVTVIDKNISAFCGTRNFVPYPQDFAIGPYYGADIRVSPRSGTILNLCATYYGKELSFLRQARELGHQPLLAVSSCLLIVFASTFHT
jgi:hypothetical protein